MRFAMSHQVNFPLLSLRDDADDHFFVSPPKSYRASGTFVKTCGEDGNWHGDGDGICISEWSAESAKICPSVKITTFQSIPCRSCSARPTPSSSCRRSARRSRWRFRSRRPTWTSSVMWQLSHYGFEATESCWNEESSTLPTRRAIQFRS